jgi:hypothetical protein
MGVIILLRRLLPLFCYLVVRFASVSFSSSRLKTMLSGIPILCSKTIGRRKNWTSQAVVI